jgi:hypothetical protein
LLDEVPTESFDVLIDDCAIVEGGSVDFFELAIEPRKK